MKYHNVADDDFPVIGEQVLVHWRNRDYIPESGIGGWYSQVGRFIQGHENRLFFRVPTGDIPVEGEHYGVEFDIIWQEIAAPN